MANSEQASEPATLRTEYVEVCKSHNGITEFRAKLLALLPLASGAGIFLLLREQNKPLETTHLPAIELFGFFVTLGLFLHELRGMRHCWELVELGKLLEEQLKLRQGQFIKEYSYYELRFRPVGTEAASWVIYLIVLLAWLYVAAARFL